MCIHVQNPVKTHGLQLAGPLRLLSRDPWWQLRSPQGQQGKKAAGSVGSSFVFFFFLGVFLKRIVCRGFE